MSVGAAVLLETLGPSRTFLEQSLTFNQEMIQTHVQHHEGSFLRTFWESWNGPGLSTMVLVGLDRIGPGPAQVELNFPPYGFCFLWF